MSILMTSPVNSTDHSRDESIQKMLDLAWAAGFIDGEGWIGIARQTRKGYDTITHRVKVAITQNNLEVLEHFKKGLEPKK